MLRAADGRGGTSNNPGVPAQFASIDLTVDGIDFAGLVLTLRPALSITGRVVFEASTLKPPENLQTLRIAMAALGASGTPTLINGTPIGGNPPPSTAVAADGTFQLTGIMPGTYSISSSAAGWWLRSIIVSGRDVLDDLLQVDGSSTDITGAVVTFSDRRSELQGTLTTASGQPASEFVVVVYPADRELWRSGARRIKSVRPGSDGAFSVTDLPAGEYLVAAITDAEPNEWQQASFLEQLVTASVKITIAEGQKLRQDLRIAR